MYLRQLLEEEGHALGRLCCWLNLRRLMLQVLEPWKPRPVQIRVAYVVR